MFNRVCGMCGDVAQVKSKPVENQLCRGCSTKVTNPSKIRWSKTTKRKKYIYFCTECSSVKFCVTKRKRIHCADCSRKYSRSKIQNPYFDFNTMSYIKFEKEKFYKVCTVCGVKREAQSKSKSGDIDCAGCSTSKKKSTFKKRRSPQISISKAQVEVIRKKNKKHQEILSSEKKVVVKQKLTDDEMIAKFIEVKEVTVIKGTYDDMPIDRLHIVGAMNIDG